MSVIKRLFGEHLMSRLTRTQNRELSFRCITYNIHRLTNLIILMIFSTKPKREMNLNIGNYGEDITGKAYLSSSGVEPL